MGRTAVMPIPRILAYERRQVAIHEAGHYVIAEHVGVRRHAAWIFPTGYDAHGPMKTYLGRNYAPGWYGRASRRREMMVGVAGAAAEAVWRARRAGDDYPFLDLGDTDVMSDGDWRLVHAASEISDRDVEKAAEIVICLLGGRLWVPLCAAARELIRSGIVMPDRLPVRMRGECLRRAAEHATEGTWDGGLID